MKLTPYLVFSLESSVSVHKRERLLLFTVLEFNDTACKPKQDWREANGEGSREGENGEGKKRSSQTGGGPGFNYKNNMACNDSESLHMVFCCFVQINKRGIE